MADPDAYLMKSTHIFIDPDGDVIAVDNFQKIDRNIPGELGRYHGCWCLGSLRRRDISSHGIGSLSGSLYSTPAEGFQLPIASQCREMIKM